MTNFISPVEKIDHLVLKKIPTDRTINVVKATRDGRVTLLLASDGKVYSSAADNFSYSLGRHINQTSTMRALRRLGVITKAQMEQHLAACEQRSLRRNMRHAADSITTDAKLLGIQLTKAQQAKIDAARRNGGGAGVLP